MTEPIAAFDFGRMFIGDEPPLFLIEIAFRTVVIYLYTLLLVRWIGSRSIGQLSLVEFLLVIALGSAVGDAMFYPDVPLLHCMLVITVVVLLDKALSFLVARSPRIEDAIEGKSVEVVRGGVIDCGQLRKLNFGHDELFEQLRLQEVTNLAQVRAAYLETNGLLSVFKTKSGSKEIGLSIDPPWDVRQPMEFEAGKAAPRNTLACRQCATVIEVSVGMKLPVCQNCGGTAWHIARTDSSLSEHG